MLGAEPTTLLDPELSLLAFQRRVLALSDDPRVPLLERLRFLGIVTSNIDELYMLRMAELRRGAVEDVADGPARAKLEVVESTVRALMQDHWRVAAECLRAAERYGVRVRRWASLSDAQQATLREHFVKEIQPALRSHAITYSPGHPLPHLPHLGLSLAVVYRDASDARLRLAEHELPGDVPRMLQVPDTAADVIPVEDVLRANVMNLYPDVLVESAHLFRVTRGGDLRIDDDPALDLLGAVERATALRPLNPAVRVEVEPDMPAHVCTLILDTLRRDAVGRDLELTVTDVQRVEGLLDLRCLATLPLPRGGALEYEPFAGRIAVDRSARMIDAIRERDLLLHHPFDSFDESVTRLFEEAALDDAVTEIAVTLYRVGTPSRIAEALVRAAQSGKSVFALVELQARFDEEHNVNWARAIERAGGRVVYGLPGLKVHAKAALIVRHEGDGERAYAHVGSGNYNSRSGRQYTDVSLFTCRAGITDDLRAFFSALAGTHTGVPDAPAPLTGDGLVAPHQLREALLEHIAREAEHARAGRSARLDFKMNALADREMAQAIRSAADAGVQVTLMVRGICIMAPISGDTPENFRILSVAGRYLEHSRVYRFENGGAPEYWIGSSDLRPRNLRRRVELLVRVRDAGAQQILDTLLARYAEDASAWELRADGEYYRRGEQKASAQELYAREQGIAASAVESARAI
jgi:polyphosphate kinase